MVSIPSYTITTTITTTKEESKKTKKEVIPITIPECLDSPEFTLAWNSYTEHRKEIKAIMTPRAANMQLKKLSSHAPHIAIDMLEQSIANGWKGVFDLRQQGNNGQPSRSQQAEQLIKLISKYGKPHYQQAKPELESAGFLPAIKTMGGWARLCELRPEQIKFAYYAAVKT